jgi:hypothetical protein
LAGGSVEEQIDETDIWKIPQIVWAESGSLILPVKIVSGLLTSIRNTSIQLT